MKEAPPRRDVEAELARAREQQAAVAAVLRTMSTTPTDLDAILDAILTAATDLCHATKGYVYVLDGDVYRVTRSTGIDTEFDAWARAHPAPVGDRGKATSRAALLGKPLHIPDVLNDPEYTWKDAQVRGDFRSILAVPLMKDGVAVAVISMWKTEQKPFSDEEIALVATFADQALIAFENVRLAKETKESLEQQTATSDLLKVISQVTSDVQPVFDTIVESAVRLCRADYATFWRSDGDAFVVVAGNAVDPSFLEFLRTTRVTPERGSVTGRALFERRVVHIPDVDGDPEITYRGSRRPGGARSALGVPILQGGSVDGVLAIGRVELRPFSESEVALAQTFADQAAIAIENVRLFNETKTALEQQRAISDVLVAIGRATSEVQPVFQTILDHAGRLCDADRATIALREGDVVVVKAGWNIPQSAMDNFARDPFPADRTSAVGRAVLEGRTLTWDDMSLDPELSARAQTTRGITGTRSALTVPLLRDGVAIGAINLRRTEVRPFTAQQAKLIETFAEQATLAIENVRLFNETKSALEQQTAVGDVLKTISRTAFDLQAVFDVVVENARQLCTADFGYLYRRDAETFRIAAASGGKPELLQAERDTPTPIKESTLIGRAALRRATVHIPDFLTEPGYDWPPNIAAQVHTGLAVPIFSGAAVVAVIGVARFAVQPFTPEEIRLVETFADQAAIAMENARLFNDTKAALDQQTATAEILRAISGSPTDVQPVLDAIAANVVRYCGAEDAAIHLMHEGRFTGWAHAGPIDETDFDAKVMQQPLSERRMVLRRDRVFGRAALDRVTIHVPDVSDPATIAEFPDGLGEGRAAKMPWRAGLVTPLLRQQDVIGTISLRRTTPGPFTAEQVALVETFAAQAVIAVENVRLFNETKESLAQQTAISEVLKITGASAFDLNPVLETVVTRAMALCGADSASIMRLEGDRAFVAANAGRFNDLDAWRGAMEANPPSPGRGSLTGRVLIEGKTVHIEDAETDPEYTSQTLGFTGGRTHLGVPIVRQGKAVGIFVLRRRAVRLFTPREIALVETFADQAAIAIENVRLFNETKESLERQTATAEVLKVMSSTAFDLPRVLDIVISHATRLTDAEAGFVYQVDGDFLRMSSAFGESAEVMREWQKEHPIRVDYVGSSTGRAFSERRTVHIPDVLADPTYTYREAQTLGNFRTLLSVPLLQDDRAIGVIALWRTTTRPFAQEQIALVESFADQAVIAIENVRLFDETRESLERQTAISEVLKTISRTVFDLVPTLQAVVDNAGRLVEADLAWMSVRSAAVGSAADQAGSEVEIASTTFVRYGRTPELVALFGQMGTTPRMPRVLQRRSIMARVYAEGMTVHLPDSQLEPELTEASPTIKQTGVRTVLAVPVVSEGKVIAGVIVARLTVRPFNDREIQLVETFADQAGIAIQNVRLFNDIQQKSRELEAANRHKSEFLANISHELRTPLNAIIGFSEVMLQGIFGDLNDKQREYQEDVLSSGKHLLSLITDILDLSKIEAGRMELEPSTFSIASALDSGLTIVRERASRQGITLNAVVPKDLPAIEADERKVKQILYNLLSNAVKFTPDGGRVDVRVRAENGDVRIDVQDTGIGIAPEDQTQIFQEFRQVGRERSREGTGLGLTLTKRFIELHGGRIWLESAPGKGSTFSFTLPLRRPAEVKA